MTLEDRFRAHFQASAAAQQRSFEQAATALAQAAERLAQCLRAGGKVLSCGNGGSAADAQHFAAELTGRFERERPGLAGIALSVDTSALTAIGNDYGFERVFEKQLRALGRRGDVLLAISTSGNSRNVEMAVTAAQELGMTVIALTGKNGGRIGASMRSEDLELRAASDVTARIQEVHILMLHCLCDAIDTLLFPE
jgi:D-sedoheptulose 7-phosphate isomerase